MFLHPFEVPTNRLRMRGAMNLRRRALGKLQRRVESLIGIKLRDIRPEVDVALPRLVETVVNPAEI